MAGDWIKMRMDLIDDPAVIGIGCDLSISEYETIGRLHKLWCWADRHTVDGATSGVDTKWVDRFVQKKGFAAAMEKHGWLKYDTASSVLSFPNFTNHNGESAKARCDAVLRQRKSRERGAGVTNGGEERTSIPKPFIRAVYTRDGYQCVYCGNQSSPERELWKNAMLSIDHIAPHSRADGRQAIEDLATCCRACNSEKTDRTPEEWGLLPTFLQPGVSYIDHKLVTKKCDLDVTSALPEKRREETESPLPPTAPASPSLGGVKKLVPTTPEAIAVAELFGRRTTTAWDGKEVRALKATIARGVLTKEAMDKIARYYHAERAKGDDGKHRRDLKTFLNNFDGELDRANAFAGGDPTHRSGDMPRLPNLE